MIACRHDRFGRFSDFASIATLVVALGMPSPASSTEPQVDLLRDQPYLVELQKSIEGAKESIDIVSLDLAGGSGPAREIADLLIVVRKKKPQVRIRVFLEGGGEGASSRISKERKRLKKAGVFVKLDPAPLTRARTVCVDGRIVYAGSQGLSGGSGAGIRVESSGIGQAFTTYFESLWRDSSVLHSSSATDGPVTRRRSSAHGR